MSGGNRLCADRSGAKTGGILMAGRKPKPTALKKLEGNPGKRKLNAKEPVPAKGIPAISGTCIIRSILSAVRSFCFIATMVVCPTISSGVRTVCGLRCGISGSMTGIR